MTYLKPMTKQAKKHMNSMSGKNKDWLWLVILAVLIAVHIYVYVRF